MTIFGPVWVLGPKKGKQDNPTKQKKIRQTGKSDKLWSKTIRQTRQSGGPGRSLLACLSDFLSSMFVGLYSLPDFLA